MTPQCAVTAPLNPKHARNDAKRSGEEVQVIGGRGGRARPSLRPPHTVPRRETWRQCGSKALSRHSLRLEASWESTEPGAAFNSRVAGLSGVQQSVEVAVDG